MYLSSSSIYQLYKQSGIILLRENSNIESLKNSEKNLSLGVFLCMPMDDLTPSLAAVKEVSRICWELLYFLRTHSTALFVENYHVPKPI